MGHITTADALRDKLMAPRAIDRVHALHALERLSSQAPETALARELEAFTARGIPYYAPADASYLEWVDAAVALWEQVHKPRGTKPAKVARAPKAAKPASPARRATRKAEPVT